MQICPLLVLAVIIVTYLLWPKGPKKTMAEQTREYNERYYADKKPRRF